MAINPMTIQVDETSRFNDGSGEIEFEFVFVPIRSDPAWEMPAARRIWQDAR